MEQSNILKFILYFPNMWPLALSKKDKETLISCYKELQLANSACHLNYIFAG